MKINNKGLNLAPFFVTIGAISYGIPATIYNTAFKNGVTSGVLLCGMFLLGFIMFFVLVKILANNHKILKITKLKVIISGSSIALTNTFYMISLIHTSVAVSAVLLMQSVWISILIACFVNKTMPSLYQICVVGCIIFGTILATDLLNQNIKFSYLGAFLALLSAITYAFTIQFTKNLALNLDPIIKAKFMCFGAFLTIFIIFIILNIFGFNSDLKNLDFKMLEKSFIFSLLAAFFSLIVPLVTFSYYMKKLRPGIGEIITSVELPSAIFFAYVFLNQNVNLTQIIGVLIILISVIFANYEKKIKI